MAWSFSSWRQGSEAAPEGSTLAVDHPAAAQLFDVDAEKQLAQEQVCRSLQKEGAKAPAAEVEPEQRCSWRRAATAATALALIATLAIALGATLLKDKGLPPVPVPSKVPPATTAALPATTPTPESGATTPTPESSAAVPTPECGATCPMSTAAEITAAMQTS